MGLFDNKYPYTDFHELNLDWFLTRFKKLEIDMKRIQDYIKTKNFPIEWLQQLGGQKVLNVNDTQYDYSYYVSIVSGSDIHGEGTREKPFKTVEYAIKHASIKYNDIRVRVIDAGTYYVNSITFANAGLHLISEVPGVKIVFNKNAIFYNSHLNLQGVENGKMTITVNSPDKIMYLDSGDVTGINIDFDCVLRLNGAWGTCADSVLHNLFVNGGVFTMSRGNVIKRKIDQGIPAIRLVNSKFYNTASFDVDLEEDQIGDFIYCYGSSLILTTLNTFTSTHKYLGGVTVNFSDTMFTGATVNTINSVITNPYTNGVVTNNFYKPVMQLANQVTRPESDDFTEVLNITNAPGACILAFDFATGANHKAVTTVKITTSDSIRYINISGEASESAYGVISTPIYNTSENNILVEAKNANGVNIRTIVRRIDL